MVDHPKTNSLNRSKFFAAVRLIQLFQNGQKVSGPGLQSVGGNVVVMRPPFFEGVTGVSATPFENVPAGSGTGATGGVAAPVPSIPSPSSPRRDSQLSYATTSSMLLQGQGYPITTSSTIATSPTSGEANTALTHDPYLMLPGEKIRYESLFPQYAQEGEFVYGAQAVELFTKSGLSKEALRDIWNLVDNPVDNRLDILEFAIAMHLIVCVSKKNLPLPKTLPFSLKALKNREAASVQQKHQQQQQQQQQSPNPTTSTASAAASVQMQHVRAMSQGTFSGIQPSLSYGSGSGGTPSMMPAAGPTTTAMPLGGATATGFGNVSEAFEGLGMKTQQAPQGTTTGSQEQNYHHHQGIPSPPRHPQQQQQPQQQYLAAVDSSIEPYSATSNTNIRSSAIVSSSKEELGKVKAVLQKLQAENVSLKAQLGQYSEEEKSIRDEIAKTVSEIDTLSHDLTLLRSQVVEAKGNLIEASAELKAQVEKRELIRSMLHETIELKNTLEQGLNTIRTAEESVKEASSRKTSLAEPPGIHNTAQSSVNPFDDAKSVLTDNFGDASVSVHHPQQQQHTSSSHFVTEQHPQHPPLESSYRPSYPQEGTVTDEEMQKLATLKSAAERAETDARNASDHANALGLQFEDIRNEADGANAMANEKQNMKPKKKGLFKGSSRKKAYQKDVEEAMNIAAEKSERAQRAYENLRSAQEYAAKMKQDADKKRADADRFELELADKLTTANHPHHQPQPSNRHAVMSAEEFGAVARGQRGYNPELNSHSTAGYFGYSANVEHGQYRGPSPMGFGGYPGSPSRFYRNDNDLMGGAPHQGLMGSRSEDDQAMGTYSTNSPSRSVVNVDTNTESFQDYSADDAVNYMAGNHTHFNKTGIHTNQGLGKSVFPTDSSLAGMSDAGISYASDRHSITEQSHTGVSYASIRNGMENHPVQNNANPMVVLNEESSNFKDYPSSESYHPRDGTISQVAPLPPFDFCSTHTGNGTDSSIQGSVSRAGTISEHYDNNINPNYCTESSIQDSRHSTNVPSVPSGNLFVASTEADKTGVHDFDGIPSPEKDDTFELNGGGGALYLTQQDRAIRDHHVSDEQNLPSFDYSNRTGDGYNERDLQDRINASSDLGDAIASSASMEEVTSQDSRMFSQSYATPASSLDKSYGMMKQTAVEVKSFDGIPSPEKNERFHNVSHQLSAGFGGHPSSSLEGGIPTPTASNSMTNPFE